MAILMGGAAFGIHHAQAGEAPARSSEPVSLATFVALPRPKPTLELAYGPAPSQQIDVFLPPGDGPHPVVILVHGGCWRALPNAGREQLRHLGAEFTDRGMAVWSIGYRRADEAGGGFPGTFDDVSTALDHLRSDAGSLNLDLARTTLVGHSAGGHLALWAAARAHLPEASPLRRPDPFRPRSVIALAGIGDLQSFAPQVALICGPGIIERLTGAALSPAQDHFAEVSPAALPPPPIPVVAISGVLDRLVPPYAAFDYAQALRPKTKTAPELVDIPRAGHFDLVTPGTAAWAEVMRRIEAAMSAPQ